MACSCTVVVVLLVGLVAGVGDDDDVATTTQREACPRETTDWTPCSTTCGMGISIRVTNDNKDCASKQERRLCLIRPCGLNDKHMVSDDEIHSSQ